jgi:hypothetical protein
MGFVTNHGEQPTRYRFTRALARRGIRRRYGRAGIRSAAKMRPPAEGRKAMSVGA